MHHHHHLRLKRKDWIWFTNQMHLFYILLLDDMCTYLSGDSCPVCLHSPPLFTSFWSNIEMVAQRTLLDKLKFQQSWKRGAQKWKTPNTKNREQKHKLVSTIPSYQVILLKLMMEWKLEEVVGRASGPCKVQGKNSVIVHAYFRLVWLLTGCILCLNKL